MNISESTASVPHPHFTESNWACNWRVAGLNEEFKINIKSLFLLNKYKQGAPWLCGVLKNSWRRTNVIRRKSQDSASLTSNELPVWSNSGGTKEPSGSSESQKHQLSTPLNASGNTAHIIISSKGTVHLWVDERALTHTWWNVNHRDIFPACYTTTFQGADADASFHLYNSCATDKWCQMRQEWSADQKGRMLKRRWVLVFLSVFLKIGQW